MKTPDYQQLISESVKDLPQSALAEIVDYIYFLRKRTFQPQAFEEELRSIMLNTELKQLSSNEEAHLEKEFEDYDKLYPRKRVRH
ncbi:MAG: hypothetical protein HZA78_06275 [Candidatus Schekmanbacteria bacterium]|nr:hypothetical protein [Candidatus Schekmanbacteria bacterium]